MPTNASSSTTATARRLSVQRELQPDRGPVARLGAADEILAADRRAVDQFGTQRGAREGNGDDMADGVEHLLRIDQCLQQVAAVQVFQSAQDQVAETMSPHPTRRVALPEAIGEEVTPQTAIAGLGDESLAQVADGQGQAVLVHQAAELPPLSAIVWMEVRVPRPMWRRRPRRRV